MSAVLTLGASVAAFADEYPPTAEDGGVTAPSAPVAPGQGVPISVSGVEDEEYVRFTIVGGPAGATLSSIVVASAGTLSVDKVPVNGTATAIFTSSVPGNYAISAVGESGTSYGTTSLAVAGSVPAAGGTGSTGTGSGSSSSSGGLAVTGGVVPATALWLGVGAIGIGGIAVAAVAARRRAASGR